VQSKEIFRVVGLFIISVFILKGCGKPTAGHWSELVPETTLFIMVPEQQTTLEQMLSAPYIPWFDDISPAAFQLVSAVQEHSDVPVITEALLLYPIHPMTGSPFGLQSVLTGFQEHFLPDISWNSNKTVMHLKGIP
jgi:hypothetical protein